MYVGNREQLHSSSTSRRVDIAYVYGLAGTGLVDRPDRCLRHEPIVDEIDEKPRLQVNYKVTGWGLVVGGWVPGWQPGRPGRPGQPHLHMQAASQELEEGMGRDGGDGGEGEMEGRETSSREDYYDEDRTRDPLDATIAWRDGGVVSLCVLFCDCENFEVGQRLHYVRKRKAARTFATTSLTYCDVRRSSSRRLYELYNN